MAWWDFFKVFTYAFTDDPLSKRDKIKDVGGAGISDPSGNIDVRAMASGSLSSGGGSVRLRDTDSFIDLSTVTNRIHRYKEYDRLRSMPEIEMAMTVFADEACLGGDTLVATPAYDGGFRSMEWLAKHKGNERFLVYCYDFTKQDFTLGWAFDPRLVKEEETVKILLGDGTSFVATRDHRILDAKGKWVHAGELKVGSRIKPFYHIPANTELNGQKHHQFPRVYSFNKGWVHERQFIDEWKEGKDDPQYVDLNRICRMVAEGLGVRKIKQLTGRDYMTIQKTMERNGFSNREIKWLGHKPKEVKVVGVFDNGVTNVYDLSVEKYQNFCTNWGIAHNCQKNENGRVFEVECKNQAVKEELDYLLFNRNMINFDQKKMWNRSKNLFINGDEFWEVCINPENPKDGVINVVPLPADTMYRIETTKGRLVEFQQSKEGPDYNSLSRVEVTKATEADLQQATAIRFAPEQIIHIRIGDDRKTFYPYGVSLIEAARGPAHQLRLMEDSIVVYRLCVTGNVNVFTDDAIKKMKDVTTGDVVFSYADGKLITAVVTNKWMTGVKPVYEVSSQTTSITATDSHPILVRDKGTGEIYYVAVKDIEPGVHQFIHITRDLEVPKQIDLNFGKKFPDKTRLPDYVNEDFAGLFGFLVGNSWVRFNKTSAKLVFSSGLNDGIDKKYSGLLKKYFGRCVFRQNRRRKKGAGEYVVNSFAACKIMESLGLAVDGNSQRVPTWLFTAKKEIRKAFVQGLCDAAGSKQDTDQSVWSCRLGNQNLIEDVKYLWQSLGLYATKPAQEAREENWPIEKKDLWCVFLTDKQIGQYEDIAKVTYVGEEEVYDLEVGNEYHNFIANGVPIHNSRAPERRVFYIDVQQMAHNRAEAFIERMKDQLKKKKIPRNVGLEGASAVEERWHPPAVDEDIFIPIRPNANTRVETLPGACLSLDTDIPLLDGRTLSLQEVIDEVTAGKKLWVYSCNPHTGELAPGKVTWAGVTRKNTQVLKVWFDNGENVVCTPDHKFPIWGKGFVEAKDLKHGNRLIPYETREVKIHSEDNRTYCQVYDSCRREWRLSHNIVSDFFKEIGFAQGVAINETVAYLDSDHCNNNPDNLSCTLGYDQYRLSEWIFSQQGSVSINHTEDQPSEFENLVQQQAGRRIAKVEWGIQPQDVGTLTVDGQEEFHGFHTFALGCGVFTKNSNLGEIDDTVYFRNKLFIAMNFPKNYFNNEDSQTTRISLSAQDVKFARMIERLQSHIEDAIWELCDRHLKLRGYPEESYDDLVIKFTPPSDWRELTRAEVVSARIQNAGSLKGAQIMSDFDILTKWMKYSEDEAKEMLARLKIQKLEDLKLQILAQNPQLLGVGMPGPEEDQISTEPQPNNPMPGGEPPPEVQPPSPPEASPPQPPQQSGGATLPEPSAADIEKYNLDIKDFGGEQDREEQDYSEM